MPRWHHDLEKRKITGGKKKACRSRKGFEAGGYPTETKLGTSKRTVKKVHGGKVKTNLRSEKYVNVTDRDENITKRTGILRVIRNPVNADYNRRKIITRGAVIETPLGEAVITSRPGQDGVLNAILSKKKGLNI